MTQILNVNQFKLMGNIGKEPEIRQTDGGHTFVNFSIAHSEKKYQGDGYETHWYNCVARGQAKEDIANRVKDGQLLKGAPVELAGKLSTRSFTDRSGNQRTVVELIVFGIIFYQKRAKSEAEPRSQNVDRPNFANQTSGIAPGLYDPPPLTDDQLPF